MKISIGVDHGALLLREALLAHLRESGHEVIDHGTDSPDSVDYPDFSAKVAADVAAKRADFGILCCTTGIGMSISANKVPGVRAASCHYVDEASLCRRHNDANVLCLGGLHTTAHEARCLIDTFLSASFEGGRHARRVGKFTSWEHSPA